MGHGKLTEKEDGKKQLAELNDEIATWLRKRG